MPTLSLPDNQNQGLDTYSKILGIQQQAQTLQTGKYLQQTAAAEAARSQAAAWQEQQKTRELQFMAVRAPQLMHDPNAFDENHVLKGDYVASQLAPAMPTTWPEVSQHIYQAQEAGIKVNQAAQEFNNTQRTAAYTTVAGSAMSPDFAKNVTKASDYADFIDSVKKQLPENARGMVDLVTANIKPPPSDRPWTPQEVQHLQTDLEVGARPMLPPGEQNALVTPKPASMSSGAVSYAGTTAPMVGPNPGAFTPQTSVRQLPGPSDQLPYVQARAGIGGEVATDTTRFNAITNAAATSQSGIALSDQVGALAKQVRTGRLTKEWADRLAVLQQDNPKITARQMLGKYAAQLQTMAQNSAATDTERNQIHAGMPDPDNMDPAAVEHASQFLHGYFRMAQDRGRNAMEHVSKSGVPGLAMSDTAFTSQKDPFVYAFRDMPRDQQKQFLLERFGPGKSKALDEFESRVNQK